MAGKVTAPAPTDAAQLTTWAIQCIRPEIRAPNATDAVQLALEVWYAANDVIPPVREKKDAARAKAKIHREPQR
jgi:hypothetical protein